MDVLVLGGTSFVGRAIVDRLLERGHAPTLFTRGQTGPDLFPQAKHLLGDRSTGDYASLQDSTWDAVVDVSAYVPRHLAEAAGAIARTGRYLFISTGSVYDREQGGDGMTEDTPRLPEVRDTEEVTGDTYGGLKVSCENDLVARYGDQATIVRPGIVAGPHDPTDRFTYWARRAGRGGRVALPGRLDQPVQVVDSRDLAALVVTLLEDDRPGTYNAVGDCVTMRDLIEACGTDLEVVEVAATDPLPLLLPADGSWDVMFRRSAAAAHAVGLTRTPLATTAADTRAWDRERGEPALAQDLSPEREQELLGS